MESSGRHSSGSLAPDIRECFDGGSVQAHRGLKIFRKIIRNNMTAVK